MQLEHVEQVAAGQGQRKREHRLGRNIPGQVGDASPVLAPW